MFAALLHLALRFAKRRNRRPRTGAAIWRKGRNGSVDTHRLLLDLVSQLWMEVMAI